MRKLLHSSLFFFSCCLFSIPPTSRANQADNLSRFIRLRRGTVRTLGDEHFIESFLQVHLDVQDGLKEADKVEKLPGQPEGLDFQQYAGYVNVDAKHGRALFYYFVESPVEPSKKPLILWLNGGPGCSSLGFGAMEEIGPFRVKSDGKSLYGNENSWIEMANLIFLESPAGVGFSYSNTSSDYERSGDKRTAEDTFTFLVNWFERFPEYKSREFYITGESYSGHYGPQIAQLILIQNKFANQSIINLKGIAIGNAYVDEYTNFRGTMDFLWTHALYSDETHKLIRKKCSFSEFDSLACLKAQAQAAEEIGWITLPNIYAPLCHEKHNTVQFIAEFDPCTHDYVHAYLNQPDVQKALHAVPGSWFNCSELPWSDSPESMLDVIKNLTRSGLRMWLYSGDVDAVVPVTSTRYFITKLGLSIDSPWRPWYTNNEVGGYVISYEGLTFATIRGAGHEAPGYQPERALTMISAFLHAKPLLS
ncbi:hypothetical protein J5N97_009735 [Dioscorea zingiberensis]|uniref:Carboxypeptidase n=1 Tax=Dioscorea zingiberensis TaxID=325984 RepID=A0A9D5HLS1_9LILI|nr:hypothetical protein J5N97_009735 [Dioscorea zingiberensis]